MLSADDRRRIAVESAAQVGAELWQAIAAAMASLEGRRWHGGADPELFQLADGRLAWLVGSRQFMVEGEFVVEDALVTVTF